MILHRRAMLLLGCLILAGSSPARAGDVLRIVTPFRPPYVVNGGAGFADGPAIRLIQRMAELAQLEPAVEVLPFERALLNLDRGDTLYPALLRTPARESRYQWIGEVFTDHAVLFTRKGALVVRSLAEARQFGAVSVMRGSELASLMKAAGLTNIAVETSDNDNARMLAAGRVDAWFAPSSVGHAVWERQAFDPADLQASGPLARLSFWVAAAQNLDPAVVMRLRQAYADLRATGEYDQIVAGLREPPS